MPGISLDRLAARVGTVAAVVALVAAGCGESDDGGEVAGGSTTQQTTAPQAVDRGSPAPRAVPRDDSGPTLLGDRAQARAGAGAVDDVYAGMRTAVAAGVAAADTGVRDTLEAAESQQSLSDVCDLMSEGAKRRTIVYVSRSAGLADVDWTCEKATGVLLRRAGSRRLERTMRVTVVGVNADGDRATATVRFGGKEGRLSAIPLVKEDGKWKLGQAPGGGS